MMVVNWIAILLGTYVGVVIAFETLVVIMGARQATRGVQPGEDWIVIATTDANGSTETVVAGVESDGQLYVSANHWLRGWHRRELERLAEHEEVFVAIVTGQGGGDLRLGGLAARVPVVGQHEGIRFARDDVAKDRDARDAGDVADHVVELEVHEHQGLLYALDVVAARAPPRNALKSDGGRRSMLGGAATTGPSTGCRSSSRGVRTLILLAGAPT